MEHEGSSSLSDSLSSAPILSQIDPVYVSPSNLSKIQFNIILPCMPGFSKDLLY